MAIIGVSPEKMTSGSPFSRWRESRLARHWDVLAVFLLVLASFPTHWLAPHSLPIVQHPGTFDDHWIHDAVFKATRGVRFGVDVAFPYGPIFQWLCSAPTRWSGFSMGKIPDLFHTFLLWCTYLFGYVSLRLLMPQQAPWKRFLLLLAVCIFWSPWDGRAMLDIFLFAVFLRAWYALRDGRLSAASVGVGAAIACAAGFLYSADTGVYGVAGFLVALAGVAWESRTRTDLIRRYVGAVVTFIVATCALVLVINALLVSVLDFRFWKTSLALVSVHRWNEPSAMSASGFYCLAITLILFTVIFVIRGRTADPDQNIIAARPGFLLGAYLLALGMLQSGFVRSDSNHIAFALFAMVCFGSIALLSFRPPLVSVVAAVVIVGGSLLWGQPAPVYHLSSLYYRYAAFRRPITTCPGGFMEFQGSCYSSEFAERMFKATSYIQQHSSDNDSVLIFPYQYMYGVASGRNVASGVLQSFLAANKYLSDFDIAGMQKAAAPVGLYFPDGNISQIFDPDYSLRIDGVSNFTRNPDIWLWMIRNYDSSVELFPGVPALKKNESRATVAVSERPLLLQPRTLQVDSRNTVLDLGDPMWPANADFLRLRLRVNYPIWWKLRKPEQLQLEITRADGSREWEPFVLEPNASTDVWFYPWKQSDLSRYFKTDESQWRVGSRSAIVRLRLSLTPFDWISQQPTSVTVESADAVTLSLPSLAPSPIR